MFVVEPLSQAASNPRQNNASVDLDIMTASGVVVGERLTLSAATERLWSNPTRRLSFRARDVRPLPRMRLYTGKTGRLRG
jgi:hypothetical protein